MSSDSYDEEYEVEAIRDRRIFKGRVQYLIKWKNYPELSNTWEDEANLDGCKELLKDFMSKLQKKSKEKPQKKIEKIEKVFESNGKLLVKLYLNDKSTQNWNHNQVLEKIPGAYFRFLEEHSTFRVEK